MTTLFYHCYEEKSVSADADLITDSGGGIKTFQSNILCQIIYIFVSNHVINMIMQSEKSK